MGSMPILSILWLTTCAAGLALSLASARVLAAPSRATRVAWLATAAYFLIAGIDDLRGASAPFRIDDVFLAVLAVAFVIAGRRDEPQAEPWQWPTHAGLTGAQRRAASLRRTESRSRSR